MLHASGGSGRLVPLADRFGIHVVRYRGSCCVSLVDASVSACNSISFLCSSKSLSVFAPAVGHWYLPGIQQNPGNGLIRLA